MQITELFCACWKEKSKTGRDLCNYAVFLTPLCCFAGIEMQKGGNSKRRRFQGYWGVGLPHPVMCTATFPKQKVYLLFLFLDYACYKTLAASIKKMRQKKHNMSP
jgi:hypothetical protein